MILMKHRLRYIFALEKFTPTLELCNMHNSSLDGYILYFWKRFIIEMIFDWPYLVFQSFVLFVPTWIVSTRIPKGTIHKYVLMLIFKSHFFKTSRYLFVCFSFNSKRIFFGLKQILLCKWFFLFKDKIVFSFSMQLSETKHALFEIRNCLESKYGIHIDLPVDKGSPFWVRWAGLLHCIWLEHASSHLGDG